MPSVDGRGPVIVVGAGPGIGAAVARRFGGEGHPVGLVARNETRLRDLASTLGGRGIAASVATADATDPGQVRDALGALTERMGPPQILCFSPLADVALIKPVLETTPEDIRDALALNVVGAAAAVGAVLPAMLDEGRGTLLFTTGSAAIRPSPARAVSGIVYAGENLYVQMLAEALADEPVEVFQTVIVGAVGPGEKHEPDTVAEHLWQLHHSGGELVTVLP